MDTDASLPKSTLVVLFGASKWPHWTDLNQELSDNDTGSSETFAGSAEGMEKYLLDINGFNLPASNLLNLFNAKYEPAGQLRSMATFLEERLAALRNEGNPATQLVIYYVGHGGFAKEVFYLVIRNSEKENKIASSLNPESLAEIIKEKARELRCLFLIDCCFAGAAESAFNEAPINGVSLLCSSASNETSRATRGMPFTMFSGTLLQVLQKGNREGPQWFSLRNLRDEIKQGIRRKFPENGVMPVVLSPVQRDEDIAELQLFPNFGRKPGKDFEWFKVESDLAKCYVIESATEEQLQQNEALKIQVRSALNKYKESLSNIIGKNLDTVPIGVNVDQVIASLEGLENAIKAMCQAEIAVFDVTNYEPVVMLLLGIRAVVRRGVTIASSGGDYVIGDPIDFPFSIKEVNIISHSKKQAKIYNPIDIIGNKMIAGFEQLQYLPDYLDLPVFDAIRTLPPEREQRVPKEYNEQVLMLCPFNSRYTEKNWETYLKPQLEVYLPKTPEGESPRIIRTLDVKSPRLVSQSLYEAMRLTQMCVVDWTEWRPTVFFELGVRLAAVNINPVCIIETNHKQIIDDQAYTVDRRERFDKVSSRLRSDQKVNNEDGLDGYTSEDLERFVYVAYQCRRMLELFNPIEYRARRLEDDDLEVYKRMVSFHQQLIQDDHQPAEGKSMPPGFIYQIVSDHIDVKMEINALQVHDGLMREANTLSDPQIDSAGRSPLLYPNNESLAGIANEGAFERRLAAWYYIDNRLKGKSEEDPLLRKKCIDLGNLLARSLLRSDKDMANRIRQRVKELKAIPKQEDQP